MVHWLIRNFNGYLIIKIFKNTPERFANLCSNHDIFLWNVVSKDDYFEACIKKKDFKRIKTICKKTKTRVRILSRHGLPFFLYKNRKRKMYLCGIILSIAIIYILSLFVWDIELTGNVYNTESSIVKCLSENGIKCGMRKKYIKCNEIEELIREKYNDIIWVSVELKGTRILIKVQEGIMAEKTEEDIYAPSNLIARYDCIINEIMVRNGTPKVKKGSVVKKGDVLVNGAVEVYNDSGEIAGYDYYAADADINGTYVIPYKETINMNYYKKEYTNRTKLRYYVKILNKKVKLLDGKIVYNKYDVITNEKRLKIGRNLYLPIVVGDINIREYTLEEKKYTKNEAEQLAKAHLKHFLSKIMQKGVQIVENNVKIHIGKNSCVLEGNIVVNGDVSERINAEIFAIPEERTNIDELN